MTAGEAPKSSCTLTAIAPAATDSSTAAGSDPPLPNRAKFNGECSVPWRKRAKVVVLPLPTSNTGPGLPPISVVVPPASACSDCSGDWICAWHSMAPAVTMKAAPEMPVVVWPTIRSG